MRPLPELQALLRHATGNPPDVLRRLLSLCCELLDLEMALVGVETEGGLVRFGVQSDGTLMATEEGGLAERLDDVWGRRVRGSGALLVPTPAPLTRSGSGRAWVSR